MPERLERRNTILLIYMKMKKTKNYVMLQQRCAKFRTVKANPTPHTVMAKSMPPTVMQLVALIPRQRALCLIKVITKK